MFLELKPTSIAMSLRKNIPGEKSSVGAGEVLSFNVGLTGRDHLDLETGEVFQDPTFARGRGANRPISATLTLRPTSGEDYFQYSCMPWLAVALYGIALGERG